MWSCVINDAVISFTLYPPYTSTLPIPTSPCPASLPSLFLPTPTDLIAVSGAGGYDNIVTGPTDKVVTPGEILIMDTGTQKRSDENRDENREAMRNEGSPRPEGTALRCVCARASVLRCVWMYNYIAAAAHVLMLN